MIDLRKGGLLTAICDLPYQLVVPLPIRESEVLDFSQRQWRRLDDAGLVTHDLTSGEVGQALELKKRHPALSANDCFCYVTALTHEGILLTGDALLRRVASGNGLRVHGVLWVVDELSTNRTCPRKLLRKALRAWQADASVFLPEQEVSSRLECLTVQTHRPGTPSLCV
ncbi:MAG: type II toxin-antitoxin system VapC family toxin [Acidobacteria bacterium]|nr:type II toxin-antitoxin system VapC family toxin [Acidobacteriota bacterium]